MTQPHVRVLAFAVIGCASLVTVSCSRTSPSTPTQPARVAESLTVAGSRTLAEGETATLVASVRWSTGVDETVTDGVVWASDDPRIASVDQRGVVTAMAAGDSRIRATFSSVSGTTAVTVTAGLRAITGVVHESFPTDATTIAGATVAGVDASGSTQSTITDSAGRFTLRLVPGAAHLSIAAPGYEAQTLAANLAVSPLSLGLAPSRRELRVAFDYIYPPPATFIAQRKFRIDVHHPGELRAAYLMSYVSASAHAFVCLEVRDAANRVLAHERGQYDLSPAPVRIAVTPGAYEVSFYSCGPPSNPFSTSVAGFAGEIKHPS